jgi:hypothetical protein
MTELIKKLWMVAWDQWEHCNAVLHDQENLIQLEEVNKLNHHITQGYQEYQPILPSTDQHFFLPPCHHYWRKAHGLKRLAYNMGSQPKEE